MKNLEKIPHFKRRESKLFAIFLLSIPAIFVVAFIVIGVIYRERPGNIPFSISFASVASFCLIRMICYYVVGEGLLHIDYSNGKIRGFKAFNFFTIFMPLKVDIQFSIIGNILIRVDSDLTGSRHMDRSIVVVVENKKNRFASFYITADSNTPGTLARERFLKKNEEIVKRLNETIWQWREDNNVPHPENTVNPFAR